MNDLIEDWCRFCEGNEAYDKSHFSNLFNEATNVCDFGKIFQYFDESEELIKRLTVVKGILSTNKKKCAFTHDQLFSIALQDLTEKKSACANAGDDELVNIINNLKPIFSDNISAFERTQITDWPYGEYIIHISDYMLDNMKSETSQNYALLEAFYGLCSSFPIQWYLASPIIKTEINFDGYIKLWANGFDYTFNEKELIIIEI